MTDLSCVCDLYHSSQQRRILNPLSKARDWTFVLMNTSHIHFHWDRMGTPPPLFFNSTLYLVSDFRYKSLPLLKLERVKGNKILGTTFIEQYLKVFWFCKPNLQWFFVFVLAPIYSQVWSKISFFVFFFAWFALLKKSCFDIIVAMILEWFSELKQSLFYMNASNYWRK